MPELPAPLQALLTDPRRHLAGTDLRVDLALGRNLLNEVLAARPAGTPVEELYVDPEGDNLFNLHLAVRAPVVGNVRRKITFQPGPAVSFPDQPWLTLRITDGFRLLDKPVIKLMRGQLAERLPAGVELTSDYLRLHVPALLTAGGYQSLVPLIRQLALVSIDDVLTLRLWLDATGE